MKDLIELANLIDRELPEKEQKEEFCDLFLKELGTLKGTDLAPSLSECVFDMDVPGTMIVLKFPVGAHVFDSFKGKLEGNGLGRNDTDGACVDGF